MAPIKSTWAWRQTRFEKSGANGAKNRIIMVGRVRTSITSFWQIVVTSVPYPSCLQMAKVEQLDSPFVIHEVEASQLCWRIFDSSGLRERAKKHRAGLLV